MELIKIFLSWIVIPFPQFLKRWVYRHLMGYKIGRDVKIGYSWLCAKEMIIGDGVRIGNFNRFKNIPFVSIGPFTVISSWNHFTSNQTFYSEAGKREKKVNPQLIIGSHVGIAIRHYLDIQDELIIGDFTTIAGIDSQLFTHQIDIINSRQSAKPIRIGKYCMIGSGSRISPGTTIRDYTVVAMGSTVHGDTMYTHVIIAGNPAVVRKTLSPEALYFNRAVGRVERAR